MSITSSSTVAQVLAEYNDNLSWEGNVDKARLALAAIRWLLINRPETLGEDGRNINYASLEAEKTQLEQFVRQNTATTKRGRSAFTQVRCI